MFSYFTQFSNACKNSAVWRLSNITLRDSNYFIDKNTLLYKSKVGQILYACTLNSTQTCSNWSLSWRNIRSLCNVASTAINTPPPSLRSLANLDRSHRYTLYHVPVAEVFIVQNCVVDIMFQLILWFQTKLIHFATDRMDVKVQFTFNIYQVCNSYQFHDTTFKQKYLSFFEEFIEVVLSRYY